MTEAQSSFALVLHASECCAVAFQHSSEVSWGDKFYGAMAEGRTMRGCRLAVVLNSQMLMSVGHHKASGTGKHQLRAV